MPDQKELKRLEDVEKLSKRLDRRDREIKILKAVSGEINASLDLNQTLQTFLEHLDHYFDFKHSMVLLANENDPFLTVCASHGYEGEGSGAKVRIGKGIIGTVAKRKKMLNMPNIMSKMTYLNPGHNIHKNPEQEITIKLPGLSNPKSQVAFPLLINSELVGVFAVESEKQRIFKYEDEQIISIIAEQAAAAIQKATHYKTEQKRHEQIQEMNDTLSNLYRQQQETLTLFMKYVPESVVNKALRNKPESIFDGEQLDIAVLFCDIRGFTKVSERLSPSEVVSLLNSYYQNMSQVIAQYEGVVNQFVGDEIFVTFGAPIAIVNCEEKAVRCAIGMIEQLDNLNNELNKHLKVKIEVGIGVNFGPVIAGNLGSEDKIEYSVTGDTVNTGKRIESLTKMKHNTVLISESIYNKVKELFKFEAWEPISVKGKSEKIAVYEVVL
jgi:adenylate cyclase